MVRSFLNCNELFLNLSKPGVVRENVKIHSRDWLYFYLNWAEKGAIIKEHPKCFVNSHLLDWVECIGKYSLGSGLLFVIYQTTIYCFLYCCSCEGVLAVCTTILDLCYLNTFFGVLDPMNSISALRFHGERLCVTEKHAALELTKLQCACLITECGLNARGIRWIWYSWHKRCWVLSLDQLKRKSSKSPRKTVLTVTVWLAYLFTWGEVFQWFQNCESVLP